MEPSAGNTASMESQEPRVPDAPSTEAGGPTQGYVPEDPHEELDDD